MPHESLSCPFSKVPAVTLSSYFSHRGFPTPYFISYPLLTSSFCGDIRMVYIQQTAAYVTLLVKNFNLSIDSSIKSKLPSLTSDSCTILACVFTSPRSHICVLVTDCSLCILASCAFLPAGNIPSSQHCPLGKPPMANRKFHCSWNILTILRINCSSSMFPLSFQSLKQYLDASCLYD